MLMLRPASVSAAWHTFLVDLLIAGLAGAVSRTTLPARTSCHSGTMAATLWMCDPAGFSSVS
jgi:hypothetical protein